MMTAFCRTTRKAATLALSISALLTFFFTSSSFACGDCGVVRPPPPPYNGFGNPGEFDIEQKTVNDRCTALVPTSTEKTYGVFLWVGNAGTEFKSYQAGLEHIASHGFVVVSAPSSITSPNPSISMCLDALQSTPFKNSIDFSKIAVGGHGIGGSSAIAAGSDPRVSTVVTTAPTIDPSIGHQREWHSQLNGPLLQLVSESDPIVDLDQQEQLYDDTLQSLFTVLLYNGGYEMALGDMGEYKAIITGWLFHQFYNDDRARELFYKPKRLACTPKSQRSCETKGRYDPYAGFEAYGRFHADDLTVAEQCIVAYPTNTDKRHGVLLWIGDAGTTIEDYIDQIEHISTHGFIVVDVQSSSFSPNKSVFNCLDALSNSAIKDSVDFSKIAVGGHGVGASSAIAAGSDPRISTVLTTAPNIDPRTGHQWEWYSKLHGPLLQIVHFDEWEISEPQLNQLFNDVDDAFYLGHHTLFGHNVNTMDELGKFEAVFSAWLAYRLNNDENAAKLFEKPYLYICAPQSDRQCVINGAPQ